MKSERFVITDNVWEKIWRHTRGQTRQVALPALLK